MTDELFDYFGKGSKKFEPLDDDLDLPEVSPKRRDDTQDQAAELEPVKASAQPIDDIPLPSDSEPSADDDDDVFAGFGAGLFDASTDELPPRKQVAKAKPAAAEAKQIANERTKPAAKAAPSKAKPAAAKPAVEEVSASQPEKSEDSEGGTWDFIAGVLGIGGKKNKADEDNSDESVASPVAKNKPQPADSSKGQTKADVKSLFQEPKPAPEAAVDALFNTADDGLDLAGWGDDEDEPEEPVATKPAKVERPARSGRGRNTKPANEGRGDRSRPSRTKAPVVDDLIDDDEDGDDENFIEFEVEELTPSARDKKDAPSGDRPRRRRRPGREINDEDSVSSNDSASKDAPRSRSRSRSDRDEAPAESRTGGRGRNRGRGRGRDQNEDRDQDSRSRDSVVKAVGDSADDDWRDDKPEADSEPRSERSRGSRGRGRGRGRKRPERQDRDSKPFDDDVIDDELEISSFVDDDADDTETEEAPKKSRRSRRPRSRGRGRNRNDNDRDDSDHDSVEIDDSDLDSDSIDSESSDRGESKGRGSSGRSRRGRPGRDDRDRDSEPSPRRGRNSRDSRDRDDSRNEKPPVYAEVPTWDETIESMIESNIKNHESSSNRGRGSGGGGGRGRGGNNRNSNSRNRR